MLIGDGPARPRVEQLARRKGVDATFVGHVGDPGQLAEFYASADIFA
jgi:alpha-1,6-mannosyltransferase